MVAETSPPPEQPDDAPPAESPAAPKIDIRRLLMVILIVAGGLVYFFWDDVRDVLQPPDILAPAAAPEAAFQADNEIAVKAGALDVTFTTFGAAVTHLTWTAPDGHVQEIITQEGVPNLAFVVAIHELEDAAMEPFDVIVPPTVHEVEENGETFTEVVFRRRFEGGPTLRKTFRIRHDRPTITLHIDTPNAPAGYLAQSEGYVLTVCNAVGQPDDLGKDDPSVSYRADDVTHHLAVRRLSGVRDWPSVEDREAAGHGGALGDPLAEWVAASDKYFTVIARPVPSRTDVGMSFTRTASTAASVRIRAPWAVERFQLYAGPKDYDALAALPGHLEESIDHWYLGREITLLLRYLHERVFANYGVAIVLLTLVFRLLMWPVTGYNLKSMVKIKKANAALAEIDAREPPRAQREARAAWLREARVWEKVQSRATLGMALPLLILLPVLLILYYALNTSYTFYRQPLALWITDISQRDPIFLLPVLMGLAMMGQLRTMSEDPSKERSWYLMPLGFTVLFAFFSAGLVLFWLTDTLVGWGQLVLIKRSRRNTATQELEEAAARAEQARKG